MIGIKIKPDEIIAEESVIYLPIKLKILKETEYIEKKFTLFPKGLYLIESNNIYGVTLIYLGRNIALPERKYRMPTIPSSNLKWFRLIKGSFK